MATNASPLHRRCSRSRSTPVACSLAWLWESMLGWWWGLLQLVLCRLRMPGSEVHGGVADICSTTCLADRNASALLHAHGRIQQHVGNVQRKGSGGCELADWIVVVHQAVPGCAVLGAAPIPRGKGWSPRGSAEEGVTAPKRAWHEEAGKPCADAPAGSGLRVDAEANERECDHGQGVVYGAASEGQAEQSGDRHWPEEGR